MLFIYTMGYYSAVKENESIKFPSTQIKLGRGEDILSEFTRTPKDKCNVF